MKISRAATTHNGYCCSDQALIDFLPTDTCNNNMSVADRLKKLDGHSSVSNEFRVYTIQGAVLSVVTVLIILYLVITEVTFNFQVQLHERVRVNMLPTRVDSQWILI